MVPQSSPTLYKFLQLVILRVFARVRFCEVLLLGLVLVLVLVLGLGSDLRQLTVGPGLGLGSDLR